MLRKEWEMGSRDLRNASGIKNRSAFNRALIELQRLEGVRSERDRLRAESERVALLIVKAEADVRRLTDALLPCGFR